MSVLLRLAFLCCLSSALAQTMEFAGVYVTGMTVIGRPGPDSSCPPIVWIVTPNTPAAEAGIKPKPAAMTLVIDRDGIPMTFVFELARASEVAEENHKRMYKGRMIPSVIPPAYLHCFEAPAKPH
jgi:hypothetical protein